MFGYNVKDIAEGFYNDITKRENELHDSRMNICRKCPLFINTTLGPKCNPNKCYNITTGEISDSSKLGFICGCNCFLDKKTRVPGAHCILNKW